MATIAFTGANVIGDKGFDAHIIVWALMTSGTSDVGSPYGIVLGADRSIQVTGTFGVGGNCRIQGCNEATPVNWATLTDPQGNALDFTAAKIEQVSEMTRWIRPSITAGDGTTSLTVTLLARRPR